MHVITQGGAQGVQSAQVAMMLIAVAIVVFWRALLRLVLALLAIAVLVAIGSGVLELAHGVHL
jgi:hypothetical protein